MKRNINFKNVLCMAAITLVTGMLGGCEDNSIATPVGKLPNETALDNNFGMLKCDMTTSDLEITMTNTKTPDFAFFYQTVKWGARVKPGGTGHPNHNENRPRLSRQIQ